MGIKPGLKRINLLLQALGNPHHDLRVVHVAGTNGKGSTTLMIARVLSAAGYRTGRYSSPHLHSYRERFEVDDRAISPGQLHACLEKVLAAAQTLPPEDFPTEFEILTAIAFLFFKAEQVDIAVLETGMGGSYDATSAASPCLCVITGVDYDHTAYLGETLAEIAANKAGIIKPGIAVVAGPMEETALQVVAARAAELGSPLLHSSLAAVTPCGPGGLCGQWLDLRFGGHDLQRVWFSLPGRFQLHNLGCALTALLELEKMSFALADEYIKAALGKLHSKGRLEVLSLKPLIICDVAHNRQAAQALNGALRELLPGRPRVLVCGMVDDKDAQGVLSILGEGCAHCVVTRPLGPRSHNWKRLAEVWQGLYPHIPCTLEEDIVKAADLGKTLCGNDACLVVTGSFYVIDKARQHITKARE